MQRRPVLSDHKRKGKTLVPPFVHMVGPLQDVSWLQTMIPELAWISLLHEKHGSRHAVELLGAFSRIVRSLAPVVSLRWLAPVTTFAQVSASEWERARESLAGTGDLFELQQALEPLIVLYPECPLAPIFAGKPEIVVELAVQRMKGIVGAMFQRVDRDPMMAQASALWLAFDSGILKVSPDTCLARFPEVQDYPKTEISREIGSAIRSSLNAFFGNEHHYPAKSDWPRYFWNRGLEVSPCECSND